MAVMAGPEPIWSEDLGASSGSPMYAESQLLGPSSAAFLHYISRELNWKWCNQDKPVLREGCQALADSNLTCCATVQALPQGSHLQALGERNCPPDGAP